MSRKLISFDWAIKKLLRSKTNFGILEGYYIYKGSTDFIGIHNHDQLKLSKKQLFRQMFFEKKHLPEKQKFEQKTIAELYPEYYLININRFNDVAKDTLDEWIFFLKNEEIKEDFSAKGLLEAKEKLDLMKLPAEQRKAYEAYQDDLHYQASMFESSYGEGYLDGVDKGIEKGIKTGIEKGIEKGIDKGKLENIREIVLRMHKKGLDIEIIAEFAGITQNDVKNILKLFMI